MHRYFVALCGQNKGQAGTQKQPLSPSENILVSIKLICTNNLRPFEIFGMKFM